MSKPSAAPSESRERFEEWAKGPKLPLKRDGRLYAEYMTELAWLAWQSAERDIREQCAQLLKEEAGEIGTYVAYHIEEMYPGAVKATPKSFLLSVRNFTSNKIAALAERVRGKGAQ